MEVRRTFDPIAVTTNELKNEAFPCWMRCSRHEIAMLTRPSKSKGRTGTFSVYFISISILPASSRALLSPPQYLQTRENKHIVTLKKFEQRALKKKVNKPNTMGMDVPFVQVN